MKIYYTKQKALDSLQKDISNNLGKYQSSSLWVDQYFVEKEIPKYYFDTGIEVDDYELVLGGPETDFKNAKIIFEAFRGKINPIQASDMRLWTYLAHVQHWDYMLARWKIDVPDEDDEPDDSKKPPRDKVLDRIKTRYFFGSSRGKAFVRQGIARLYWGAYLTYDEASDNPYEYTEFFFTKQDVFTSITERSYARNKVLILAALKVLKKHPDLSRADIRLFLAKLNQSGAITVLDFLDAEQATQLCEKVMDEVYQIPSLQEGSTFELYDNITGKPYEHVLKIVRGKVVMLDKLWPLNQVTTEPKSLLGKKEGSKVVISQTEYVIKEIREGATAHQRNYV